MGVLVRVLRVYKESGGRLGCACLAGGWAESCAVRAMPFLVCICFALVLRTK
jgi:hypothetical protein